MAKTKNAYEMLLDENNHENVIFYGENHQKMEFEQIALIHLDGMNYVILHPVDMGYADDEVIVYALYEFNNKFELIEVEDEGLLNEINEAYEKMVA